MVSGVQFVMHHTVGLELFVDSLDTTHLVIYSRIKNIFKGCRSDNAKKPGKRCSMCRQKHDNGMRNKEQHEGKGRG